MSRRISAETFARRFARIREDLQDQMRRDQLEREATKLDRKRQAAEQYRQVGAP